MFNKIKKMFSAKDKNKPNELDSLASKFATSPEQAISEAKNYLMKPNFSDFDEFINEVKKTQKSNCCIVSWSKAMLSARCLDCQLHDNSCICIPCYLAGKHDQHHSYLLGGSGSGNCDCGDPNFWKPSGNCPNHPGPDPNPDITQMTPENRTKFIDVFTSAYTGALNSNDDNNRIFIFDWITKFISYGDGLRRCVAIAVTSVPDEVFFENLKRLEQKPLNSLMDLFGKLISDQQFAREMGAATIRNYLPLREIIKSIIMNPSYDKKSAPFHPIKKYLNFAFHFFNEVPLMYLIETANFDWVDFLLECIEFVIKTVIDTKKDYNRNQDGQIISQIWYYTRLLEILMKKDDQHENLQRFIDKYSQLLINYERLYSFNFPRVPEDDCDDNYSGLFLFIYLYQINCIFCQQFDSSPKNKVFSISKTFSSLLEYIKSKKNFSARSLYSQISVPISAFIPLHHLFYCLLSSHQNASEVLSIECKENGIPLQDFCNLSVICPLRILAAIFVPERFRMLNHATFRHITYCLDKPEESFNIFFGFVQTILGIAPDKEQILKIIAITFGVDDEIPTMPKLPLLDRKKQMQQLMDYQNQLEMRVQSISDVSIFIMSLLTDRSIITYDKILFKRLRVIELLKNKKTNSMDIEKYVNDKLSNPIFGDDLQSFAERVSTSNGSFFQLKNDAEFTPFFPVIYRPNRTKIIMKYTDKLIPTLDYIPPPRNLEMKSCFRLPTFISLMYGCLSSSSLTSIQIGLSMFVECLRNGEDFPQSSFDSSPTIIESSSVVDLTETLQSILSEDPHCNFLTIKVKYSGSDRPISIIEAVQSNHRLGYAALERTNLPSSLRPQLAGDDELQKEKKARAANLKQRLMKEFQNKRSQFSMGAGTTSMNADDDDDDEGNLNGLHGSRSSRPIDSSEAPSRILCNICQTNVAEDILGFPCLSLPSLFPAIINNDLHKLKIGLDDLDCVFSMSICLHHVHYKCCIGLIKEYQDDAGRRNENKTYNCMIDRGVRNCFLPLFHATSLPEGQSEFSIKPSEILNESIQEFVKRAFFGYAEEDPLVALKSFAGMVTVLEVRHRSRPECLDHPTVPLLYHNLLLTLYFSLHGSAITEDLKDPLVKLVYLIINSEDPEKEFQVFVKQISSTLKDDYLYEFLRRAAIIEEFAIKNRCDSKSDGFIDWDEILSFENLLERFEIDKDKNLKMIELPLFETIPLADRFVGLYQPPYNMDIFDTSISKFIDLLTGSVVVFAKNYDTIKDKTDLPYINDYVLSYYKGGLAMFLALTGPNASDIIISCSAINRLFNLDGFYVDQFGDIDRGFKRGAILQISKDRLENTLDKLLSGDVILY